MFLRSLLILAVASLQAQTGDSLTDLVAKARQALKDPAAGRAEGERLLAQALGRCRPPHPADAGACAQAAILIGLSTLAQRGPFDLIRSDVANAVHYYEGTADQTSLALALETLAAIHSGTGNLVEAGAARQRASALRTSHIEELASKDASASFAGTAVKIGPGISPPKPSAKQEPTYSDEARIAKHQGSVLVSIVIDADGSVRNVKLLRSLGFGLDEAAYEAVRTWQFQPSMKDGQPLAVSANVELNFRLL